MILPVSLVPVALRIAHEGHIGISLMKRRIRDRYYWSGIDKDIEDFVHGCDGCKLVAKSENPEPIIRSRLPEYVWQKLAIDFLGPTPSNEKIMVLVDYFSRYFEYKIMHKTNAEKVIEALEEIFNRCDYPEEITADNGPPFDSIMFKEYCDKRGIRLRHSLPYNPRMNGEVEVQNKAFGKAITIAVNTGKNWRTEVEKLVSSHRMTPHTVTGKRPLELMTNRNRALRGKLHTVAILKTPPRNNEEIRKRDLEHKEKGKMYMNGKFGYKISSVKAGDYVLRKIMRRRSKWDPKNYAQKYLVIAKEGETVTIEDGNGKREQRAIHHLVKTSPPKEDNEKRLIIGGYIPQVTPEEPIPDTTIVTAVEVARAAESAFVPAEISTPVGGFARTKRTIRVPGWQKDFVKK